MGYLKALGILRLVGEQKDSRARGYWRDGVFILCSDLDADALAHYLCEEYQPTPFVAPWNAGSGFFLKWDERRKCFKSREAAENLERIRTSTAQRLNAFRAAIDCVKRNLVRFSKRIDISAELQAMSPKEKKDFLNGNMFFEIDGQAYAITKEDKDAFLAKLRSTVLDDASLSWLDSTLALTVGRKKNRHESPLLGTGGNAGNSDFSAMFFEALPQIVSLTDPPPPAHMNASLDFARTALFRDAIRGVPGFSIGQFDPGRAGGANQGYGPMGDATANPWDYVLLCEGALVPSGAISRRAETSLAGASFPFTVRRSVAGGGAPGEDASRGETWLPLWDQPAGIREVRVLFAEGRAEIGRRRATSGVEFARAIASLGVERGISSFVRFGYQERLGQSYLAVPMGQVAVRGIPHTELLRELDPWLDRFRFAADSEKAPRVAREMLRRIDASVFDFCLYGGRSRFAEVLCSLGQTERYLARAVRFRDDKRVAPVSGLSASWAGAAFDRSVEFELALALTSIYSSVSGVGPLRSNLEPVESGIDAEGRSWARWVERDPSVLWNRGALCPNLSATLARRLMDGQRTGCERPPIDHRRGASLDSIAAFILGRIDENKLESLLWGLSLTATGVHREVEHWSSPEPVPMPRAFALLKLPYLNIHLPDEPGGKPLRPESSVVPLLESGRGEDACRIASRRLVAAGLTPMGSSNMTRMASARWRVGTDLSQRIAAALLIPVRGADVPKLIDLVVRPRLSDRES